MSTILQDTMLWSCQREHFHNQESIKTVWYAQWALTMVSIKYIDVKLGHQHTGHKGWLA